MSVCAWERNGFLLFALFGRPVGSLAKPELTIIATQKAMKRTRNAKSLHFQLWFMMPLLIFPSPLLVGYLPMINPNGQLRSIFVYEGEKGRQKPFLVRDNESTKTLSFASKTPIPNTQSKHTRIRWMTKKDLPSLSYLSSAFLSSRLVLPRWMARGGSMKNTFKRRMKCDWGYLCQNEILHKAFSSNTPVISVTLCHSPPLANTLG